MEMIMEERQIIVDRILKAATLEKALDIILNPCEDEEYRIILLLADEVCHHLARLLNNPPIPDALMTNKLNKEEARAIEANWNKEYYELGKKAWKTVSDVRGRHSLIAVPIMKAWSAFIANQLENSHLSNKELCELYEFASGEIKDNIVNTYLHRLNKQWINNPLEKELEEKSN